MNKIGRWFLRFVPMAVFALAMVAPLCGAEPSNAPAPLPDNTSKLAWKEAKPAPGVLPYRVAGEGKCAVVFIHGFMDAGNVWDALTATLRGRGARMVTLDLPFMGSQYEATGPVTLTRLAEDVIGVVDDLAQPTLLVGHSMGTQIAELVARARPDAIEGMVLVTPVPLSGLPVSDDMVRQMRETARDQGKIEAMRRQSLPGLEPAVLEKLVQNSMKVAPENVAALIRAWSNGVPSDGMPPLAGFPVMLIGGAEDPMCTPEVLALRVAPRFADAETRILPKASHWPHISHVGEVAELIDRYLDKTIRE